MEMSNPRAKVSYHNVRIFVVVTLIVTLCYPALINTAAVRPEQLQRVLLEDFTNVTIPQATEDSNKKNASIRICYIEEICGWAVYCPATNNTTRYIDYFMKNTCKCPDESYKCVRVRDNLSTSAYEYRCRQNTTAMDIVINNESTDNVIGCTHD
ncbi:PREDICTED: uncharacterized protein LOC105451869 isoform X2 [Wasmannia auropunctata]|uniref:uncharacterized protein LOC105451869 isoform X2 n=1 Tax=Wasmannia auropunctata TaxID=64793 RepID=UPI0005EF8AB2|nr:PREDICTED: uncharacterized protein LOC105451869 isoform X2 [Wasmannia auropunctata]